MFGLLSIGTFWLPISRTRTSVSSWKKVFWHSQSGHSSSIMKLSVTHGGEHTAFKGNERSWFDWLWLMPAPTTPTFIIPYPTLCSIVDPHLCSQTYQKMQHCSTINLKIIIIIQGDPYADQLQTSLWKDYNLFITSCCNCKLLQLNSARLAPLYPKAPL